MSECKFESAVKIIPYTQDAVYGKISDLRNLEKVIQSLSDPAVQQKMKEQMPDGKLDGFADKLKDVACSEDSVSFSAPPVGDVCLRIAEREAPKCVKLTAEGLPVGLKLWIQILPEGENACKMKITAKAELNIFIKGMVSKPLQQGVDKLSDILASVPYDM